RTAATERLPGRPLPVQRPGTGDRQVGTPLRVDQRRVVVALDALPPGQHQRVLLRVGAEQDGRARADVEVDVVQHLDRAGEELAGGYHPPPATGRVTGLDGLGEGGGVVELAVPLRAVVSDQEVLLREGGRLDPGQDLGYLGPGIDRCR